MASSTSPESAAQRIPPELFKRIIDNLKPQELDGSTRLAWTKSRKTKKLRGQQQKHELGQCSLVCRYWAVHCRGPIFRNVEIRTLEDAHRLLEFAKTSTIGISIGSYISSITVRAAVPSLPWIHLITNAIPHDAFPNLNSYTINVSEAPFSEAPELRPFAPRSVFYGLPRSLPATKRPLPLSLRDLRFAAFADMISFIESFVASKPRSHSASLYLDQITWADGNTLMPSETPAAFRGMRRRWRKHFKSIVSNNCTDAWPLVWLLVTAERPKPSLNRTPPFVDGMEVRRLTALVQVIMDNCQCTICSERKSGHKSTSSPGHLPSVFMKEVEPERGSRDHVILNIHNEIHELVFRISSEGHVTKTTFRLKGPLTADCGSPESFGFDWAALDKRASVFNAAVLSVSFPAKLYSVYERFVRDHMPLMESSGRLELERQKG